MKKLSIKSYGVTLTIPSEILLLENLGFVGKANDHLILSVVDGLGAEKCFMVVSKNGIPVSSIFFHNHYVQTANYIECSYDRFLKMKSLV